VAQSCKDQNRAETSTILDQPQGIPSLELMTSWKKDVTWGIQPRFVYQSTSLDYYELVED
jgi:hypothetical protein